MEVLEYLRTSMWIVGAATTIVTIGLGVILGYHWKRYAGNAASARIFIGIYCTVALVLLLVMFGSIPA